MRQNAQKLQYQSQMTKNSSGLGSPKHAGAAFAHTGIQKQKSVNTPLLFKRIWGKCYTHNVQLRGFYRKVLTKCTSNRRQTYADSIIYYEITCRASRVIRICKLEVFQQNGRTYEFWSYVFSVFCKYLRRTIRCWRVSHNQGYHLVCTWGQKWSFLHCPKNNCTWKSIDYSVWNPNFAKLSLIFIEIYKFENPSLTRHFCVGGATQCWYDIHFYWVLLMIIFNWTY